MSQVPFKIHSLHIYPVKGCRAIDLGASRIGPRGLVHDREWLFVTADGRFVTQRSHPTLALLQADTDDEGVTLTHPQVGSLRIERPQPMNTAPSSWTRVTVWKREIEAIDAGAAAAQFAAEMLAEPGRLVAAGSDNFVDGYPLLVCTQASLAALNERLPTPLPMNRFRPNIVLEGALPWQEDEIDELRISGIRLKLVKACTRCGVTAIDQQTGRKALNPLPVLQQFRFDPKLRGVTFGQNARVASGAGESLRVGDAVTFSPPR